MEAYGSKKPLLYTWKSCTEDPEYGATTYLFDILETKYTLVRPADIQAHPELCDRVVGIMASPLFEAVLRHRETVDKFPQLKGIVSPSIGLDHIDLNYCKRRGLRVAHVGDVVVKAVADLAMGLLLASARNIFPRMENLHASGTLALDESSSQEIHESTVGIIGLGRIGSEIAKRALGFDMKILYHTRKAKPQALESQLKATYFASLEEMLPLCDFVVISCTLTSENQLMMGQKQFKLMKKSATLVNIARGRLVDHDALVAALEKGEIYAAGLDVTHPEPLPTNHPLWNQPNIIITPHIGTLTPRSRQRAVGQVMENLEAICINNSPLPADREVNFFFTDAMTFKKDLH